jgi:flagellin
MPLVINTNAAATQAANNLSSSNVSLQKSLNRLSSGSKIVNPADDAGGLAVSMKLSAAARRMGAASTNLSNTMSYLQTQDGALTVTAKILNRIGELKTLSTDPTKSASDISNYNSEFKALQQEISSISGEKFNGTSLFSSSTMSVATSEDQLKSISMAGINLMGTSGSSAPDFNSLSGWTTSGTASASGGTLTLASGATATTIQSFSGAFSVSFHVDSGNNELFLGGVSVRSFGGYAGSTLRFDFDGAGSADIFINGTPHATATGLPTSGQLRFTGFAGSAATFSALSITGGGGSGTGNVNSVATASDLSSLSQGTITNSIQDIATYRAQNGANQSRISFSLDLLTTNKANLEQANSRISDVDVADESTALAKSNVLVQAGTAMLSQANQAAQGIVRLIS